MSRGGAPVTATDAEGSGASEASRRQEAQWRRSGGGAEAERRRSGGAAEAQRRRKRWPPPLRIVLATLH